jgi:hypothetical protein
MASAVRSTDLVDTSRPARHPDLLAAVIEGSFLTHQSLHTAHSRREFRILDIQLDIGGELPPVTVRAQVIGPGQVHCTHNGEDRFGAQLTVVRLMATTAGNVALFGGRGRELQQLAQGGGASAMHGRAHRRFQRFQIHTPRLVAALEHYTQQLLYFARDFLVDGFGRFFSSGDRVASTGRARQIFSFTSSNSWLSCRKR